MRAKPGHHFGGRDKGEGRAEDRLSGTHILGHQHHRQCIRARRAGNRMRRTAMSSKLPFQLCNFRSHDELAMIQNCTDGRIDTVTDAQLLGAEINERDGWEWCRRHDACASRL